MPEHRHRIVVYQVSELGSQLWDDLGWLKRLPVTVAEEPLDQDSVASDADVHLLFLTEPVIEKHSAHIQRRFAGLNSGAVISVALEPLLKGQSALPTACRFEVLRLYGLTDAHRSIRLTQAVLQRLDLSIERSTADGWERGTELLPEALLLRCGDREHRIPPDYRGLFTIGRGQNSQLTIDSNYASRLHGCFRVSEGTFTYRDMSSNGTRLLVGHDERIVHDEEVSLNRVGLLRIGGVEIHFATSAA